MFVPHCLLGNIIYIDKTQLENIIIFNKTPLDFIIFYPKNRGQVKKSGTGKKCILMPGAVRPRNGDLTAAGLPWWCISETDLNCPEVPQPSSESENLCPGIPSGKVIFFSLPQAGGTAFPMWESTAVTTPLSMHQPMTPVSAHPIYPNPIIRNAIKAHVD